MKNIFKKKIFPLFFYFFFIFFLLIVEKFILLNFYFYLKNIKNYSGLKSFQFFNIIYLLYKAKANLILIKTYTYKMINN